MDDSVLQQPKITLLDYLTQEPLAQFMLDTHSSGDMITRVDLVDHITQSGSLEVQDYILFRQNVAIPVEGIKLRSKTKIQVWRTPQEHEDPAIRWLVQSVRDLQDQDMEGSINQIATDMQAVANQLQSEQVEIIKLFGAQKQPAAATAVADGGQLELLASLLEDKIQE